MREIKFRAWSKESKKIMMNVQNMYDSLGKWYDNHGNEIGVPYNGFPTSSFGEILDDKNCIVMQYTGLKDKNGNEIYEGDIVKDLFWDRDNIYSIIWDYGSSSFQGNNGVALIHDDYIYEGKLSTIARLEIIGNIYENPELLEINESKK